MEKDKNTTLTVEELQLFSQILYASKWNVQQTQETIIPLINKVAKMIDEMKQNGQRTEDTTK